MSSKQPLHDLIPSWYRQKIRDWIQEDVPTFDYSGHVVGTKPESAILFGKSDGILAGVPFFDMVFEELGCKVEWNVTEGSTLTPALHLGREGYIKVATVTGPANMILQGERTALNILAHASGIATVCAMHAEVAKQNNWAGKVAATRKTTPGFHVVQKYAVLVGGCDTHRLDLSSMVMLKDNAINSVGNVYKAVEEAKRVAGFSTKVEVECRNQEEAEAALEAGADIIMLDNFEPAEAHRVAEIIKGRKAHVLVEVSGNITLGTIASYMSPHIDVLSSSKLIQGVPHLDFSLKVLR